MQLQFDSIGCQNPKHRFDDKLSFVSILLARHLAENISMLVSGVGLYAPGLNHR